MNNINKWKKINAKKGAAVCSDVKRNLPEKKKNTEKKKGKNQKLSSRLVFILALYYGASALLHLLYYDWRFTFVPFSFYEDLSWSIIFTVIYMVNEESGIKDKIMSFITWLFGSLFLWVIFFGGYVLLTGFLHMPKDIKDVSLYKEIRWSRFGSVYNYFPSSISKNAKNVRFFFRSAFLQGGSVLQLRYSQSPIKINQLYERYSKVKTKSFIGGKSHSMPTTRFYTSLNGADEFSKDYEVMIFDKVIKAKDSNAGYWNHGESHGVVISKKRGVIVYWAEIW